MSSQKPICYARINKQGDVTSTHRHRDGWRTVPLYTAPSAPVAPAAVPDDVIRKELVRDLNEVFEPKGAETPQIVRDVIEYTDSWLSVFIQKRAETAPRPAEGMPAQGDAEGLRRQHDADSRELRSLCQARDEARRERDLLKVEVVALESSVGHLTRLVDELRPNGERLEWVLRRCSGSWLRARLGVVSDTADMETLTVLIDANRGAAIAQAKESKT